MKPKNIKSSILVTMPTVLKEELQKESDEVDMSLHEYVIWLLKNNISRRKTKIRKQSCEKTVFICNIFIKLQELRQKAHTELARLQPWDEWRLRGKTYCSLNLIPIQCVYEPNIQKSSNNCIANQVSFCILPQIPQKSIGRRS